MKRGIAFGLQAGLVGLILVAAGCKQPPKPMRFNNSIARANDRLYAAAKKFAKAIEPMEKGTAPDIGAAQTASNEMQTILRELQKEFDEARSPINSAPGAELLEKYRTFLQKEQTIRHVHRADAASRPGQSAGPRFEVGCHPPHRARAGTEESAAMAPVSAAHTAYCKHHNLVAK